LASLNQDQKETGKASEELGRLEVVMMKQIGIVKEL
jgi:hypothetical protein